MLWGSKAERTAQLEKKSSLKGHYAWNILSSEALCSQNKHRAQEEHKFTYGTRANQNAWMDLELYTDLTTVEMVHGPLHLTYFDIYSIFQCLPWNFKANACYSYSLKITICVQATVDVFLRFQLVLEDNHQRNWNSDKCPMWALKYCIEDPVYCLWCVSHSKAVAGILFGVVS